jgi:Family of unknown function (DUF6262)
MNEKTWRRNTVGLALHARACSERKRQAVEQAISALLREQRPINFNTVARAAAVSKAYLYSQPELRERIDALREQELRERLRQPVPPPSGKTDAGKDLVILAKDRRIKELEAENRHLQHQLKVALSKVYEQI